MVYNLSSGPGNRSSIALETRSCNPISNFRLGTTIAGDAIAWADVMVKFRGPGVHFRTNILPHYNCHGMVFAARRTAIENSSGEIAQILSDDHYEEIQREHVMPGDIVIYEEEASIMHSGVVLQVHREGITGVIVLSKWGKLGEVIHPEKSGPYFEYQTRYYRMTR